MTKEEFEEIIKPLYFLNGNDCQFIRTALLGNFDKWGENKQCNIANVGTRLFGVYSPEDDLLAVHSTKEGAEENKGNYEKQHGGGFYVDHVMLQP